MKETDEAPRRVAWAVLLIATTLLGFELIATRLFSVMLWNHFAFLAVSVALLGLGVAGVACYVLRGLSRPQRAVSHIRACALILPLVLGAAVVVLCSLPIRMDFSRLMFGYLGIVFLVASVPFVVGGIAITLALGRWPRQVNRLYAFDLIGSALGCGLVVALLGVLDGPSAALALGVLPALAAFVLRPSWTAGALAIAVALGAGLNARGDWIRVRMARSRVLEPIYERWNAFSQVTVVPTDEWRGWWVSPRRAEPAVPTLGIQIDADAFTPMVKFDGDLKKVGIVLADVTSVAYHVVPYAESVLVVGAGGGKDVLAALASGAHRVRAVEINPIIARDIVSSRFRDYTGDLYSDPRVDLVVGDGRTVLRHDSSRYDVIQVSMVDTSAASAVGAYALTENSLYTLEAAGEFLSHLRPGGLFTCTWANLPNLEGVNRLVALYGEALRQKGFAVVSDRIAVIGGATPHRMAMPLATVMVRPEGFSAQEGDRLRALCREYDFVPVYVPGDPLTGGHEGSAVAVIRRLVSGLDLPEFYATYRLDLRPVSDDRPFFFYQNRPRDAWSALTTWRQGFLYGNGLFILVKLLVIGVLAVTSFMALPMLVARGRALRDARGRWKFALYFLCLGIGFIVLEIALVQMFGYYLGHPLLGLGVSLASLLAFTGLGSAAGGRWPDRELARRLRLVLLAVMGLVALHYAVLPTVITGTLHWPLVLRVAVVVAVLAPLGFLLGLPFPTGLRLLSGDGALTPWAWAINGGASVLGATLAMILVMHLGFATTLLAGGILYAAALATVGKLATE